MVLFLKELSPKTKNFLGFASGVMIALLFGRFQRNRFLSKGTLSPG